MAKLSLGIDFRQLQSIKQPGSCSEFEFLPHCPRPWIRPQHHKGKNKTPATRTKSNKPEVPSPAFKHRIAVFSATRRAIPEVRGPEQFKIVNRRTVDLESFSHTAFAGPESVLIFIFFRRGQIECMVTKRNPGPDSSDLSEERMAQSSVGCRVC